MAGPDSCILCLVDIPVHLRCTQCSILLHLIDICFLPCIYLLQISQIQTSLCVIVGPAFLHGHLFCMATFPKKTLYWGYALFNTICTAVFQNRCDTSTTCRLCRWELCSPVCSVYPIYTLYRYARRYSVWW